MERVARDRGDGRAVRGDAAGDLEPVAAHPVRTSHQVDMIRRRTPW